MKGFISFIIEGAKSAAAEASETNTPRGAAYETATALWVHNNSGAKNNPAQKQRVAQMQAMHRDSMSQLTPEVRKQVKQYAENSGRAYLSSLQKEGIRPADVREVHHTYAGIDHLVGKKVDRAGNPHDIMIKTNKGQLHGASLKFKSGTLSNNTHNSFDQMMRSAGFKNSNIKGTWDAKMKKLGILGHSGAQLKEIRDNPTIVKANAQAQDEAAAHHAQVFNGGKLAMQKSMLNQVMKSGPAVPYHYVVGDKGTSEAVLQKKQYKLLNGAKKLQAVTTPGGHVHVLDHAGNHIITFSHRPTHGSFRSIQVNGKLGTGGVPKWFKGAKK